MNDVYVLVIGFNGNWGMGRTIPEAMKAAKKPKTYSIYAVHPATFVTAMGDLDYPLGFSPVLIDWKGKVDEKQLQREIDARPDVMTRRKQIESQ